jgi:hypothetical protein
MPAKIPATIRLPDHQLEPVRNDPKHRNVTAKERLFCETLVTYGDPISKTADRIGMSRSWGFKAMKRPVVQAYATDLANKVLGVVGLQALASASHLLVNARSETVRAELAKDLMDRADIGRSKQVSGTSVEVNIDLG